MTETALYDAVADLPENMRVSQEELQTALNALLKNDWLDEKETKQGKVYLLKQQKHRG